MYLILISLRQNFNNLEEISRSIWSQKKGRDLYGKKIGIIGYGNIGKKLTSILKPFNVEIMIFDKVKIQFNKTQQSYITQVPLNKLLKQTDIISIHLPLLESTNDFLTKKEFALMKRDVVLVNTCLLYTSPSPRDVEESRMPSSA